ncbi:hypothetical protein HPP92_015070 [Vanilla planifolia]|uniref:HMA domain-containing protein n=1 Tax=Vanilla planifolia TaxID=51239 RepID=A0A835UTC0_VANPL|nr:hypothetical protein HPP92_015070 [Vanilla planifolia]
MPKTPQITATHVIDVSSADRRSSEERIAAVSGAEGIHSVHVEYYQQKVTVWGICDREDVLCAVRRKRREARFWDQTEEAHEAVAVEEEAEDTVDSETPAAEKGVPFFKRRKSWKKLFPLILYLM